MKLFLWQICNKQYRSFVAWLVGHHGHISCITDCLTLFIFEHDGWYACMCVTATILIFSAFQWSSHIALIFTSCSSDNINFTPVAILRFTQLRPIGGDSFDPLTQNLARWRGSYVVPNLTLICSYLGISDQKPPKSVSFQTLSPRRSDSLAGFWWNL